MEKTLTIMFIDDADSDRVLFRHILREIDPSLKSITAADGREALDYLLDTESLPDYIFVDINMPRMNGMEFLEKIKRLPRLADIPVIMYSTAQPWIYERNAKELGAAACLDKSMDFDKTCHTIASIIFEEPGKHDGQSEKGTNEKQ